MHGTGTLTQTTIGHRPSGRLIMEIFVSAVAAILIALMVAAAGTVLARTPVAVQFSDRAPDIERADPLVVCRMLQGRIGCIREDS